MTGCISAKPVPREPRYVIDLSKGRRIEDLLQTGVPLKLDSENRYLIPYHLENCSLLFRFPDGIEIDTYAVMFSLTVIDGSISAGEGYGMIMPVEEAYQLVRLAHITARMPFGRLEDWMKDYRSRPNGIVGMSAFLNGTQVDAPDPSQVKFSFGLGIASAINPLYPAVVQLEFGFRKDCVAPPGTIFKQIKLDPSQAYDRMDAYRGLAAEMKAAQRAEEHAAPSNSSQSQMAAKTASASSSEAGPAIDWLLWLTLFFVFLFLLYLARCLIRNRRAHQ